jgi:hypothetical protein
MPCFTPLLPAYIDTTAGGSRIARSGCIVWYYFTLTVAPRLRLDWFLPGNIEEHITNYSGPSDEATMSQREQSNDQRLVWTLLAVRIDELWCDMNGPDGTEGDPPKNPGAHRETLEAVSRETPMRG